MSENGLGRAAPLIYTLTGLIVLFLLLPLIFPIVLSISDTPFITFPPKGFTLQWYGKVLQDADFTSSFGFSVLLSTTAACGAVLLGTPTAVGLVRLSFPGKGFIQALVLSPLIFPSLVTGIALLRLFSSIGSNDAFLNLWIGHVLVTTPYVVRTVSASLVVVDPGLEEAARTLGAGRFTAFWRITRPQIMPGLVAGALFAFVTSFDNYAVSMWLFDASHVPLPMMMLSLISRMFDPGIAAIASLMIFFSLFMVLLLERLAGLRRAMSF
ncbi:ABC transporter permease [Ancylobacter defluvii]|uniref:ABC transporter permease n=1 Tax=Ancylobacter defluvii TaxID=1282440 RepID=A0A9W6NA01_9HYPH|nr:ABC transporter permease [Ancylobacter defluvii]MBS7589955.1 ABC transporter permease [Ancylobacter defluvii]GLK83080.1 ABC transporter permease [Ancylobacter defluvii]